MSEREALLRAVCENPDDDTPRLVFADWLQENGEEERAEFIRIQVTMERTKEQAQEDWPSWQRLCGQESKFLFGHDDQWWEELPRAAGYRFSRMFRRGFSEQLYVTDWKACAQDAVSVFTASPIACVAVEGPVRLDDPLAQSLLGRIRSLDLYAATLGDSDWSVLITADLPLLKSLSSRNLPADESLQYLLKTRFKELLDSSIRWL